MRTSYKAFSCYTCHSLLRKLVDLDWILWKLVDSESRTKRSWTDTMNLSCGKGQWACARINFCRCLVTVTSLKKDIGFLLLPVPLTHVLRSIPCSMPISQNATGRTPNDFLKQHERGQSGFHARAFPAQTGSISHPLLWRMQAVGSLNFHSRTLASLHHHCLHVFLNDGRIKPSLFCTVGSGGFWKAREGSFQFAHLPRMNSASSNSWQIAIFKGFVNFQRANGTSDILFIQQMLLNQTNGSCLTNRETSCQLCWDHPIWFSWEDPGGRRENRRCLLPCRVLKGDISSTERLYVMLPIPRLRSNSRAKDPCLEKSHSSDSGVLVPVNLLGTDLDIPFKEDTTWDTGGGPQPWLNSSFGVSLGWTLALPLPV